MSCFFFPHPETWPLPEAELLILPLDSSKRFLGMLNLGDFTRTGRGASVHRRIHSCAGKVPSVQLFHVLLCSQKWPIGLID